MVRFAAFSKTPNSTALSSTTIGKKIILAISTRFLHSPQVRFYQSGSNPDIHGDSESQAHSSLAEVLYLPPGQVLLHDYILFNKRGSSVLIQRLDILMQTVEIVRSSMILSAIDLKEMLP